jgi:hypothetical protein
MPNSDFFCVRNTRFFGSRHCIIVLSSQVPKKCTDLDSSLLYILMLGTYRKFARESNFLVLLLSTALLECWPQVCRFRITFTLLPTNCFVSTTTNLTKCLANWIPLRICVCLRNTQPHLHNLAGQFMARIMVQVLIELQVL